MQHIAEIYEGAGRGERGLFANGNRIAHGNPQAMHMDELRKAAREAAAPERVKEVMDKLYWLVLGGDIQAAVVWLSYTVGKPPQAVTVENEDGGTTVIQVNRTSAAGQ